MRIGIIGLPQSGKTTLFRLLTHAGGAGHEAGIGIVKVPDPRLDYLAELFKPKKVTPATIEFVDFPPLAKGAGKGEGLAAQSLAQMRTVDSLLEVVRAFVNPAVPHPEESIGPARDAALLDTELFLADLEMVEKRIARIDENLKRHRKGDDPRERPLLARCQEALAAERPLRELEFTAEEEFRLRGFQFLTAKPLLVVANVGEKSPPEVWKSLAPLLEAPASPKRAVLQVAVRAEAELAELPPEDAAVFRKELGLDAPAQAALIRACYDLLDVITFFTGEGGTETRAWTIPRGATALKAAGTIHTDLEKGFIKAEVVGLENLRAAGGTAGARKRGTYRLEGKDYVMQDGDVIIVRFNV
jgi:ribosome-binding ATPase